MTNFTLFENLRTNRFIQWMIIHLRYLLGVAFIPSGIVKIIGERFTQISTDEPIGYFFEGIYQSGFYYNFIGYIQLLAGLLLMTQRFASLGALVYTSLIVNICMITISLHFKGTWVITTLMLLATLVLLIWDYQKIKSIFYYNYQSSYKVYPDPSKFWQVLGLIYFSVLTVWGFFPSNKSLSNGIVLIVVLLLLGSNIYVLLKRKTTKIL